MNVHASVLGTLHDRVLLSLGVRPTKPGPPPEPTLKRAPFYNACLPTRCGRSKRRMQTATIGQKAAVERVISTLTSACNLLVTLARILTNCGIELHFPLRHQHRYFHPLCPTKTPARGWHVTHKGDPPPPRVPPPRGELGHAHDSERRGRHDQPSTPSGFHAFD